MKRSLLTLALLGISLSAAAGPVFLPSGENLTYGEAGNHQSLLAYTNNPAVGASSLGMSSWNFGMALPISSFGVGLEVGPVDDMAKDIDALSAELQKFETADPTIDDINGIKTKFDSFLENAGASGYLGLNVGFHVPFFPIVWSSADVLGGSVVFDSNMGIQAKLAILDSPIEYNPLAQGANQLQTNSAAYIKLGAVSESSFGYSRPVFEYGNGNLYAGLRAKYYMVGLTKALVGLSQMDGADAAINDKVSEVQDDFQPETGVGIDLGLMWVAPNYRVGATFKNVNSPSFNYDTIGVDCETKTGPSQDSCYIAKSYANEIDTQETYVMDAQVSVEAAYFNSSRNLVLNFAADTSPVHDTVANEVQWMTVSAAYATSNLIIPGVRVGYRKNLAGSALSAATAGFTLFKMLHLDLAYGLESIDVDGAPQPRLAQVNLGLDLLF
ncbi:MAG: conjugal transfer protein TraF [Gammaproteobacteria bacterium]|nr:conjugal transfer protein TraF [Gammaproteobacteria bacterium]